MVLEWSPLLRCRHERQHPRRRTGSSAALTPQKPSSLRFSRPSPHAGLLGRFVLGPSRLCSFSSYLPPLFTGPYGVRSYIPEKKQKGRRNWAGKPAEQQAVYANRRRVRGEYGKSLLRRRGELVERSFAHCYETGGMRRCHLRGRDNILKRQLVHVGAFNLSLILRKLLGAGTPRELKNRAGQVFSRLLRFLLCLGKAVSRIRLRSPAAGAWRGPSWPCRTPDHRPRFLSSSATDC